MVRYYKMEELEGLKIRYNNRDYYPLNGLYVPGDIEYDKDINPKNFQIPKDI